jgi:hypothetical protein
LKTERKLKIFTSRENVALSREALRTVLAEGRLILRPDVANGRFEGTLTLDHEQFLQEKQIDIKLVAGGATSFIAITPLRFRQLRRAFRSGMMYCAALTDPE